MTDLAWIDAMGQSALIRSGEMTALELVDAAIGRIEALDPVLNALASTDFERARAVAREPLPPGPLAGAPFLLKDLGATLAGMPQTNGSRAFQHNVSVADTELARRYRGAGLIVLGKASTPEFGNHSTTEPALFGPTRNPWDLGRTAGGSSGGSAAAVASGMVPAAHGGDGGGSIRIPASCCGLFGLKPTRGRNSWAPFGDAMGGLAVEHALTRSVRDSAAILDATAGRVPGDPYAATPPVRPFLAEVGAEPGRLRIAWSATPPIATVVEIRGETMVRLGVTFTLPQTEPPSRRRKREDPHCRSLSQRSWLPGAARRGSPTPCRLIVPSTRPRNGPAIGSGTPTKNSPIPASPGR